MSKRLTPGLPDLVFALVLISVLVGGRFRLLNDPGTLWHLRLGQEILRTGAVPRADALTYTHDGEPWVDQSWLFDAGLAALVGLAGWSAASAASALGIAAVYGGLARGLLREGRSPLVVLLVSVLAAGVGTIHFLIRPHLFTLGFVLLTLRVCQRQHETGGRRVFLLPLLTALWANLHGGFLAGPLVVFTAGLGHAVSGHWDGARRREVGAFLAAGVLCLVSGLANPYGFGLYRHVGRLLVSSGVTALIAEYQPVPFGQPEARPFECILLALVALPLASTRRLTGYDLAQTLVWLHLSLASVRHAPLFALAASPGLARLGDGLPLVTPAEGVGDDLARRSVWPWAAAAALGLAVVLGVPLVRFDPAHWPIGAIEALNRAPTDARLFHEQDWGGLVESTTRPARRAFIDDRFELYGRAGVLQYLNAIEGGPDWDFVRDRDAVTLVWVRPGRGLARRLGADPAWRFRHRDEVSVLMERSEWFSGPGPRRPADPFDFLGARHDTNRASNPDVVPGPRDGHDSLAPRGGMDRRPHETRLGHQSLPTTLPSGARSAARPGPPL